MRQISKFIIVLLDELLPKWTLVCVGLSAWTDFNTKAHMGTIIEAVILRDNKDYGDGQIGVNAFEKIKIKVKKDVSIPKNSEIKLVNPVGKAWGQNGFMDKLTITCDDVQVVANK